MGSAALASCFMAWVEHRGRLWAAPSSPSTQGSAVNPNLTALLAPSFKPSSLPAPQPGCSLPPRPLARPWRQLGVPEPCPPCATPAQPPRWHRWRAAQPPAGGARPRCDVREELSLPAEPASTGPLMLTQPQGTQGWRDEDLGWGGCGGALQLPRLPAVVRDPGGARAAPMPRAAWREVSVGLTSSS